MATSAATVLRPILSGCHPSRNLLHFTGSGLGRGRQRGQALADLLNCELSRQGYGRAIGEIRY